MNGQITEESFVQLIEANKGIIIKICNAYCPDKNFREDLAQEIVYQLWKSGKTFQPGYKFSTWMYRIALNVAISFYRKEKKQPELVSYADQTDTADINEGIPEMEEKVNRLQQLINEMNALDKAMMILYLESKSYAEIAEVLGITETNVATKLSRIKGRLKQRLVNSP